MRLTKPVKIVAMTLTLSLLGANFSTAHATQIDSGARTNIKVDDLREVVIYTETLEAENAQYKQSLESERQAVADLIAKQEEERKAQTQYADTLNAQLKEAQESNKKLKRNGTVKNCLIVALVAGIVAVAVSK